MARVNRGGVAFGAVLLMFVAFVVFGGRLLGAESHSSAPPSVPSVSDDGSPGSEPAPARPGESRRPIGSSGGALPQADGVQAVSSADDHRAAPVPQAQREDGASWPQFILYGVLVVVSLLLFVVAATTLWWMLHAWRSPEALVATGFRRRHAGRPRSFSLLLPARHEQHVLGDTIDALTVFVAVFGVVVSTYVLMAVVRGELLPGPGHVSLWEGIKFQLWQRASGGEITDPESLKRHTIDEWLHLDPALPLLAAPIGVTAMFVERLRPFAVGLVILIVTVVRPGYLPVPFVIAALPLTALLAAGVGEVGLARLRRATKAPSPRSRRLRTAAMAAAAAVGSVVISLWLPSHHSVLTVDDDAPMRQAQLWITENVPKRDRLIVDDAMWVDLVRQGRDRRNVIWSYKVDTDEQVQNWAPHGWADYEWVVSTASMRANMPEKGVLTEAMSHARTAASFGSGGKRVDVLRVDTGWPTAKPAPPAAPAFGSQVATRLDAASDPDALAALQSRTVDQRVLATLAVLVATQPVVLEDVSAVGAEEVAGTPQREFTLGGPPAQLKGFVAFFKSQARPFAAESVEITGRGLTVRFPVRATDVGLADNPAPAPTGTAALRVADMRRAPPADHLEFVRIDGTAWGSLDTAAKPPNYRAMPAGTYVMMTAGDRRGAPVIRQAFTLKPGAAYTLALFSAAESSEVAAQLAPDDPAGAAGPALRLLHAAHAAGSVTLTLTSADGGPTVLANDAQYGLITGYAPLPAANYDAVVAANGHEWHRQVQLTGEPTTLVLADGPDGSLLQQLRDVPDVSAPLDPPALTMPAAGTAPEKTPSKPVVIASSRQKVIPLALCVIAIAGAAVLAAKARGRQRQW